ncbi:esterase family protein [Alkalicoccobacillus porphyridii]|uniref:Esterase family protein n=1 Tax=Alkalicoccobacillus porphyridii TaxID=2597270 RepID=A0A553ZZ54_9BACI|nr:esterase family protein [Alkalicoccobacillus porphyridii]TSB46695.1 esterase family protein [Alkalicoccobacillus porphyridii]
MGTTLQGTLQDTVIQSNELNDEIPLLVYLPPNYTPLSSYDLVICQDGKDYFQLGRIPRQMEALMDDYEVREAIIIGVPYPSVAERRERYHPEGERSEAYRRFLAFELLPYLDEHYPTHQLASSRTLAGDSLAGTISLLAALEYPAHFGQVMMHSPYVDDHVLDAVRTYQQPHALSIYHVIGSEETTVKLTNGDIADFLSPNKDLAELLEATSFSYSFRIFEGNHTWTYWQKDLSIGLKTLLPF